jgi:hypothetical protein
MPIFNFNVTTGVSYIKIAKKDLNGVDNTLSLQELTNLRIKFPDVPGVTKYKIVNVKGTFGILERELINLVK